MSCRLRATDCKWKADPGTGRGRGGGGLGGVSIALAWGLQTSGHGASSLLGISKQQLLWMLTAVPSLSHPATVLVTVGSVAAVIYRRGIRRCDFPPISVPAFPILRAGFRMVAHACGFPPAGRLRRVREGRCERSGCGVDAQEPDCRA